MMQQSPKNQSDTRKPYIKPEIVYELDLETRAGSPLSPIPDPLKLPSDED